MTSRGGLRHLPNPLVLRICSLEASGSARTSQKMLQEIVIQLLNYSMEKGVYSLEKGVYSF